jgi:phosphoribosylformylglycinamidine synthase
LIETGVDTVHDVSDGGLLVCLAEMAMANGIGAEIGLSTAVGAIPFLFAEDQARYVIAVPADAADRILDAAKDSVVPVALLGRTNGSKLAVEGHGAIEVADLKRSHEAWFPRYMSGGELPPTN